MHKRYYAQRQHLVTSLDSLLYQLHTLSFFLSPSIWTFIFRIFSQLQCAKPKVIHLTHSLRFYFAFIFLLNIPSLWAHAIYGAAEGRAVILDFVGMSYVPSKLQLFTLDITVLLLQWLLITISYETAVSASSPDAGDMLLSEPPSTPLPTGLPTPVTSRPTSPSSLRTSFFSRNSRSTTKSSNSINASPDIILDLRFQPLVAHLRRPPPTVTQQNPDPLSLPFPSTTSFPLPAGMRMLMRAQAMGRRNTTEALIREGVAANRDRGNRETRVPGAMDADS